jgi:hypothetical protein
MKRIVINPEAKPRDLFCYSHPNSNKRTNGNEKGALPFNVQILKQTKKNYGGNFDQNDIKKYPLFIFFD